MTTGERIARSGWAVVFGEAPEPRNTRGVVVAGLCLAQVRLVVEHALYGGRWELYPRHLTHRASDKPPHAKDPWARDLEASLRAQGLTGAKLPRTGPKSDPDRYVDLDRAASELQPGDLVFRWDTAKSDGVYIGHVAVYLGHGLLLENARPASRPQLLQHRGPTLLTPLGCWPVTTVARLP